MKVLKYKENGDNINGQLFFNNLTTNNYNYL